MGHSGVIAASRRKRCITGLTSYSSNKGSSTGALTCSDDSFIFTRWHDGASTYPVNTDIIYTDDTGCTVFDGEDKYFSDANDAFSYQISSSGVVSNADLCA